MRNGAASFVLCRLVHCTDMRWPALGLMEEHSWGGPAHVGQGIDDGWWCHDWGKQCSWSVDVLAGIVSNERGLSKIQDSPSGSPPSQVFPHILKSPRCVRWCVISTPGAWTRWCMCYSHACGSSWCFSHCLRFRGCSGSICAVSGGSNNTLVGWRCRVCIREVGGEREEESVRVRTKWVSDFPPLWESGPKCNLHNLQFTL